MSSRRGAANSKASKASKFEELRRLRESGKTRLDTYEVEEEEQLYEEIDEEGYKKIVKNRLLEDDFVVDDHGEGYIDYGVDDWGAEPGGESYSEDESGPKSIKDKKNAKRKREEEEKRRKDQEGSIAKFFSSAQAPPKPKVKNTADDAEFLKDILGDFEDAPVKVSLKPKQRTEEPARKTRRLSPPVRSKPTPKSWSAKNKENDQDVVAPSSPAPELPKIEPQEEDFNDDDILMSDVMDVAPMPSSPTAKYDRKVEIKKEEDDEDDDIDMAEIDDVGVKGEAVNYSAAKPLPKTVVKAEAAASSPVRAPETDSTAWTSVALELNLAKAQESGPTPGKFSRDDVVEDDGSLKFFWMDYTEVNGALCLFGKVKVKSTGRYVSCFVKVDGIMRNLYFLPREYRQRKGRDTDEVVDMEDVYDEVNHVMKNHRITNFKSKPCSRKYAFELPDIPRESDYLKVLYPYTLPQLSSELRGETFYHVFGTNTALFEQFVLCRNVMGPSWLEIKDADFTVVQNASWCKVECQVSDPFDVTPMPDSEAIDPPPLTLMSLAMRTSLNVRDNKQEIVSITARVFENVGINDPTPANKLPSSVFTVVRPYDKKMFPPGFESSIRRSGNSIRAEKTEQGLINFFLAKLGAIDPDVFIGHQLENIDYITLLHRMKDLKINGWSRIGRMRRTEWPKTQGRMAGSFFAERIVVSGRLMCDVANDFGKSLMTKCQSWSLKEMCQLILDAPRVEMDYEQALKGWATRTGKDFIKFLEHAELDTYYIAAIALRTQMLPLSRQLTNLAGNSWARTLTGTRAERNEYILLHEFHRNKYICPDKTWSKGKQALQKVNDEDNEGDEATTTKKKNKYEGGLVFEPEKGLYDKFILVMDFNSLYPSIIQEFNICFTTVDRSGLEEDKVPEPPEKGKDKGIFPKLIANLVERRKQVKAMMKNKDATPVQLAQWDIRQTALKLTANSMYGCLGYDRSRFYARPLAMLTTYKGREILRNTKALAEQDGLQVVYGDTDSVMINTNKTSYNEAIKIGNKFKITVNQQYQLLEIDIDNVFQRLLLHAKKKYAALTLVEVNGKLEAKKEVKGLDMRRREYCALSKDVSNHLLDEIFSGEDTETMLERIHDYLRELCVKVRGNEIPLRKFTIHTKLGKNPEDYPNGRTMPQVQVALREKARGKTVRANDVISYIITGDGANSNNPAERAYSEQDVLSKDSGLLPDFEWYLVKQIFPPIERLCAPIEGTDSLRLAECLGLDTKKYQISNSATNVEKDLQPLESIIPDEERFKDTQKLSIRCRHCKQSFNFEGIAASDEHCTPSGIRCHTENCGQNIPIVSIVAQLESQIRKFTNLYYEGWLVCNDPTCGNRTRQMNVYGRKCLGPKGLAKGCRGIMTYEYSDKMLYNQLLYFASVFDVEKAATKAPIENREAIKALASLNRARFGVIKGVVDRYLEKCGRRWVSMDNLFGFAIPAQ